MRLFVCSLLGAEHQSYYRRIVADLSAQTPLRLRPVPRDWVHLTYAFLPQADADVFEAVVRAAAEVAARWTPIAITLGRPRLLFAGREPRLVMAEVDAGREALMQIAEELRGALAQEQPPLEVGRPKPPHATLARVGRGASSRTAAPLVEMLAQRDDAEREDLVSALHVASSELSRDGARYAIKATLPLRGET